MVGRTSSKFTPAKIEEIKELVEAGKNKDEIAKAIGCATNTLVTRASQLRISLRRFTQKDRPLPGRVYVEPKKAKLDLPPCRAHTTGPILDEEVEYAQSLLERFPGLRWVALGRLLGRTDPEAIRKRLDPEFAALRKAEEQRRYNAKRKSPLREEDEKRTFLKFQGNKGKSREAQPTSALKPSSAEDKHSRKLTNANDRLLKALAAEVGAEGSAGEAESFAEMMEEAKQRDPLRKPPSDEPRRGRWSETTHKESQKPIYDPRRDGKVYHDNFTAEHMGDPKPGQSALDKMKAAGRSVDDTINRYRKTW